MAVKLIVDSTFDITPQVRARVDVVPLTIHFGEQEYIDGITIDSKTFYEKLVESDMLPTTSQATPFVFEEAFRKAVEEGFEVVCLTCASKLSGTHQSAVIAAEGYEDRIFVVDSENVTIGERILVQLGLVLRNQGLSAREIAARLDEEKKNIRLLALLDTLEYLKKGGRISAATAFAGGLLSIKPVIAVEDGLVAMKGKARGSKQGNNLLRQLVEECGGIDFQKPFALAYSGLSDKLLQKYIDDSGELWQGMAEFLPISTVGCTIGTHAGPGAVAVAFFAN